MAIINLTIPEFKAKVGVDSFSVVNNEKTGKNFVSTSVGNFKAQGDDLDVESPNCRFIYDDDEEFKDSVCFISKAGGNTLKVF